MFVLQGYNKNFAPEYLNDVFEDRKEAMEYFLSIKDKYIELTLIERIKLTQKKGEFIIAKSNINDYVSSCKIREKLPLDFTIKNYHGTEFKVGDVVYWTNSARTVGKVASFYSEDVSYTAAPNNRIYNNYRNSNSKYIYAIIKYVNGRKSKGMDARYLYLYEDYIKKLKYNVEAYKYKLQQAEAIKI